MSRTYDAETVLLNGLKASLGIGVPPDAERVHRGRCAFYPWLDMEVGESFAFRDHVQPTSARVVCSHANKKYGHRRFATKTVKANGRKFVICERVR